MAPNDIATLPDRAFERSDDQARTRSLGDAWLKSLRTVALAVPSVIVPQETNYLLNPTHPRFAALRPSAALPFHLDGRLVSGSTTHPKSPARPSA